ncbi:MAG: nitroreductase family protein [Patescibacteria group bacterium]
MDRTSQYPINQLFLKRWSPRAMSGEVVTDEELMTLFEAARWAPSSYNLQPWRFLYAKKGSANWDKFFGLMVEFNQSWAKNASALVVIVSKKTFEHVEGPAATHSFDAGSAWENLALQATDMGLVTHGMQGFDYDKAREVLNVPEDFAVEAMVVVGKPGKKEELPEGLQEREEASDRKPLSEIVMEGGFKK